MDVPFTLTSIFPIFDFCNIMFLFRFELPNTMIPGEFMYVFVRKISLLFLDFEFLYHMVP